MSCCDVNVDGGWGVGVVACRVGWCGAVRWRLVDALVVWGCFVWFVGWWRCVRCVDAVSVGGAAEVGFGWVWLGLVSPWVLVVVRLRVSRRSRSKVFLGVVSLLLWRVVAVCGAVCLLAAVSGQEMGPAPIGGVRRLCVGWVQATAAGTGRGGGVVSTVGCGFWVW